MCRGPALLLALTGPVMQACRKQALFCSEVIRQAESGAISVLVGVGRGGRQAGLEQANRPQQMAHPGWSTPPMGVGELTFIPYRKPFPLKATPSRQREMPP
ncbi:unnamed protein product [Protopolystoma xenopodis]|uniref:Uncharacterized protein n=1 Tax=Protopolystoma xenopodis TaxID=117903 RepID=A0A448XKY4_9PLAT|nr:unnamed protein product [Protopolystoma xenopodis]